MIATQDHTWTHTSRLSHIIWPAVWFKVTSQSISRIDLFSDRLSVTILAKVECLLFLNVSLHNLKVLLWASWFSSHWTLVLKWESLLSSKSRADTLDLCHILWWDDCLLGQWLLESACLCKTIVVSVFVSRASNFQRSFLWILALLHRCGHGLVSCFLNVTLTWDSRCWQTPLVCARMMASISDRHRLRERWCGYLSDHVVIHDWWATKACVVVRLSLLSEQVCNFRLIVRCLNHIIVVDVAHQVFIIRFELLDKSFETLNLGNIDLNIGKICPVFSSELIIVFHDNVCMLARSFKVQLQVFQSLVKMLHRHLRIFGQFLFIR